MKLNLHHLRVFHTVVNCGSFSVAAEQLFISQPAVSKAVKELETQHGLALIDRGSRGKKLQLTDGGNMLFEHAHSIFSLEQAALNDIHARTGLKSGTLIVGTSTTIAAYWLAPFLAKFSQQCPEINLEVQVANTQSISQALIDCSIDIALVEGKVDEPRIEAIHWQSDPLVVVANPAINSDKLSTDDLNRLTWLVREPGSGTLETTLTLLANHQIVPQRTIQLGSNEAIAHAVVQGMGLAMLPYAVVDNLIELKRLTKLLLPSQSQLSRPLTFLKYRDRPASPAARHFTECLFQQD
ncbi:LysR family transcriptional regulator [Neptunicella sp. SCSIO 80796]|uniref:LysR family transcriptional regulator n=1 Tax=Neptunicella plasticusilytica TaxID=3117012 RepID=UPI003A4DF3D7